MKELVYFGKLDLLIKVHYDKDANAIRYLTHRKASADERISIEKYIIANFAAGTDYLTDDYSALLYIGVDPDLEKNLKSFREEHDMKRMNARSAKLDAMVRQLVKGSLKEFYFKRLGDSLLEFRKQIKKKEVASDVALEKLKANIIELIEAYNSYSEQKVTLDTAVPSDLRVYFN